MLGLVGTASLAFGLVTAIASELPKLDPARYKPSKNDRNSYIYTSDGRVLAAPRQRSADRRQVRGDLGRHEAGDRRGRGSPFEHRGVDLRGIARAIWQDLRNRAVVEGGSTITQQFVKNAYVKSSRSFERKLNEAALAWQLEQQWSKDRILTAYLNTIYFGNGAYGIEQASRVYFRHRAASLSSRSLRCSPASPPTPPCTTRLRTRSKRRRGAASSCARCSTRATSRGRSIGRRPRAGCWSRATSACRTSRPAPYFTNYVNSSSSTGTALRILGGGLRVRTSIDLGLQQLARQAIAKWLSPEHEAHPRHSSRSIRATAVCSRCTEGATTPRASSTSPSRARQPGSAFKPFALATALEQGISHDDVLRVRAGDHLPRRPAVEGRELRGSNLGTIDLETATTYSDNTVYAQLTEPAGHRRSHGWRGGSGFRALSRATSRSRSAARRSTRSRWRERTHRCE